MIVPAAPVSGRSPGRRGEKRPRSEGERFDDVEKRRKAGKIAIPRPDQDEMVKQPGFPVDDESAQTRPPLLVPPAPDEDIFGTRPVDATLDVEGQDRSSYAQVGGEPPSTGRLRRVRVPHQVLQNKAVSIFRSFRHYMLMSKSGRPEADSAVDG